MRGEISQRLIELARQTCEIFGIKIVKGVVNKDHLHILVSAPSTITAGEIVRRIKGRASSKLFEEFPLLRKRYEGRHFWVRGYFCVTSSRLTEAMIKNYLEHHFEPNVTDSFKVEDPTNL